MNREILLHHEASAIAAKNGCAGMYEYAKYRHEQIALEKPPGEWAQEPTVEFAFFFNPACGEGGIIQATVGASHEEDGLEGCLYRFNPEQSSEATRAILAELSQLELERTPYRFISA